jgi:hypothetical protein
MKVHPSARISPWEAAACTLAFKRHNQRCLRAPREKTSLGKQLAFWWGNPESMTPPRAAPLFSMVNKHLEGNPKDLLGYAWI